MKYKRFVKKILQYLKDFLKLCFFLINVLIRGYYKNRFPLKPKNGMALTILANGPSLNQVLPTLLTSEKFKNTDFVVFNYFPLTPEFYHIKPSHFCLADPMFFKQTINHEKVKQLFLLINEKVNWDMNLYIPQGEKKIFLQFSKIRNPYIHIYEAGGIFYEGSPVFSNWLYRKGLAAPAYYTVAIMGLYVGINNGYNVINLYGVDHSFFNGLYVDDNNRVFLRISHFYDKDPQSVPLISPITCKPWKIGDYIIDHGNVFKSHEKIAQYAKTTGTKIINCTNCSLIDSYPRA